MKKILLSLVMVAVSAMLARLSNPAWAQSPELSPRIVHGVVSSAHPTVGALFLYNDSSHTEIGGFCSGTLIGCNTFLTAAHCVCPEGSDDAQSCQRRGLASPARMAVYFEQAGVVEVASATIHPEYSFAERSDLAIVRLARPVSGIRPTIINTMLEPPAGTAATIVGFGITGGSNSDGGIKREGTATTKRCPSDLPDDQLVCWRYSGGQSNICGGDSGGPLFIVEQGIEMIAGVSSGGSNDLCSAPDEPFDTDVYVNRDWIAAQMGDDLSSCVENGELIDLFSGTGTLSASQRESSVSIEVPAGARQLRVALNGQLWNRGPFGSTSVDFDLEVVGPTDLSGERVECADSTPTAVGYCEIEAPPAGTWRITASRLQGQGSYQLTAAAMVADLPAACVGDCDGDGNVTVDEVVEGVSIALGIGAMDACRDLDANRDGLVTVDEILTALDGALAGCGA